MFIVGLNRPFYPEITEAATIEEARSAADALIVENAVSKDSEYAKCEAKVYIAQVVEVFDIATSY